MDTVWIFLKGALVLFQVIMVFNLLIVVHEWGHFLAARWRGLKIEKFQIWFGKPLWKKRINGVQYGLGSIPAGGFVALPQMAPMGTIEGSDNELTAEVLPPISPLDKIIVAIAGPLFSILLAFAFATIVWMVGYPKRVIESTVVGYVVPDSPAEAAGLLPGDDIQTINGHEIVQFFGMLDSVIERVSMSRGDTITVGINRPGVDGGEMLIETKFMREDGSLTTRPGLRKIGVGPHTPPQVKLMLPNSPAVVAGLQPGDLLLSANGEKLYSDYPISELTKLGQPIELEVDRGGQVLPITITPAVPFQPEDSEPMLGIQWDTQFMSETLDHPTPLDQVTKGGKLIWRTLTALVSPKSDVSVSHLSGPVGISNLYFNLLSEPDGWRLVFWFSVVLNVNLAILNMLPLPVLDGGHITIALVEMIRRKPINTRFLEIIQTACALALISFMIFVTWFDSADTVRDVGDAVDAKKEPVPVKFAPPGSSN